MLAPPRPNPVHPVHVWVSATPLLRSMLCLMAFAGPEAPGCARER